MKNYKDMAIGVIVNKSEAKNRSEAIHLLPTPYLNIKSSTQILIDRDEDSVLKKFFTLLKNFFSYKIESMLLSRIQRRDAIYGNRAGRIAKYED